MSTDTRERVKPKTAACPPKADAIHPASLETASLTWLMTGAAEGDPSSWDEIVRRFTNLLWAIARSHRLNNDDAADVVQTRGFDCWKTWDASTTQRRCQAG